MTHSIMTFSIMRHNIATISTVNLIATLSINNIQHNDTQHNDIEHDGITVTCSINILHNETQHSDNRHSELNCDTQQKQHSAYWQSSKTICVIIHCVVRLSAAFFIIPNVILPSVIMLSVTAPGSYERHVEMPNFFSLLLILPIQIQLFPNEVHSNLAYSVFPTLYPYHKVNFTVRQGVPYLNNSYLSCSNDSHDKAAYTQE
jgi:hypothetical protein